MLTSTAANFARCAAAMFCIAVIVGCDGRPDRVPVAGRVLIDGQPVTRGFVRFVPEQGRPSTGQIDPLGRYQLTCFDGKDGAVAGSHRVEVIAAEEIDSQSIRWHAPKRYSDFKTSGLTFDIDNREDDLTIELTWEGGQAFVEKFGGR